MRSLALVAFVFCVFTTNLSCSDVEDLSEGMCTMPEKSDPGSSSFPSSPGEECAPSSCGCATSRVVGRSETEEDHPDAAHKYTSAANVVPEDGVEGEGLAGGDPVEEPWLKVERTNEMVFVPGGVFKMGTDNPVFIADGESPMRYVKVKSGHLNLGTEDMGQISM